MSNDFDTFNEEDFQDLISEVKAAGDVPDPSPLFWNHLSARVRDEVAQHPIRRAWWQMYWQPVAAAAGIFSLVAVVFLRVNTPVPSVPTLATAPTSPDVEVSEMWRMIEVAAPRVEMESVRDAGLMPSAYATDQAIEELTPAQREALVRLLRKEMGVSE
jgi:hypothetical protein